MSIKKVLIAVLYTLSCHGMQESSLLQFSASPISQQVITATSWPYDPAARLARGEMMEVSEPNLDDVSVRQEAAFS